MTNLHVLHVSTPHSWRGGEQQLLYLAMELHKAGIQQTVVCPQRSVLQERCRNAGLPYADLGNPGLLRWNAAGVVARIAEMLPATHVHVHDSHAHTMAVMAAQFRGLRVPIIVSRRVDFPVSSSVLSRWKYNHRSINRILCVSNEVQRITAPAIRNHEVLAVIYDGIDCSRFNGIRSGRLRNHLGVRSDQTLIGTVAALADHKDHPTFIRTAAELLRNGMDAAFVIIGDGSLRAELQSLVKRLNLERTVHLAGFRNDVAEIIPDFDVFLYTSKTEGLGTSVLDAMASRVPVVSTNAGGLPEIVQHGVNGLMAPVGNSEHLAKQVVAVVRDSSLKARLVSGGLYTAHQFSIERMAQATLQIYNSSAFSSTSSAASRRRTSMSPRAL